MRENLKHGWRLSRMFNIPAFDLWSTALLGIFTRLSSVVVRVKQLPLSLKRTSSAIPRMKIQSRLAPSRAANLVKPALPESAKIIPNGPVAVRHVLLHLGHDPSDLEALQFLRISKDVRRLIMLDLLNNVDEKEIVRS